MAIFKLGVLCPSSNFDKYFCEIHISADTSLPLASTSVFLIVSHPFHSPYCSNIIPLIGDLSSFFRRFVALFLLLYVVA